VPSFADGLRRTFPFLRRWAAEPGEVLEDQVEPGGIRGADRDSTVENRPPAGRCRTMQLVGAAALDDDVEVA